jgi:hypothetical protein
VKLSNNIPICDVLLHASLTGMKIFLMMIGSVVIMRENVCCPTSIHELPRPSIFSFRPLWLSPTPTQWILMSLFPGAKRPGHEAYHFPPFNDETNNVSLFHMHLACYQGTTLHSALPYVVWKGVYRTCGQKDWHTLPCRMLSYLWPTTVCENIITCSRRHVNIN